MSPSPLVVRALLLATLAAAPSLRAQSTAGTGSPTDGAEPALRTAAAMGDSAAAAALQFGWFGRGVLAGAVAGPVGSWWISGKASGSLANPPAIPSRLSTDGTGELAEAYRAAYAARARSERREYAFMGSAVGTAVFVVAILKLTTHLRDQAGTSAPPAAGGPAFTRAPTTGCCALPAPLLSRSR